MRSLFTTFVLLALLASPSVAQAQEFFPLSEVRPGQVGTGRTVFQGTTIEEFGVEILGVLENVGPKQSLILARLSGPQIDRTSVMAGMSGSPVYIGGRLVGAIAFAFPFATEPLAGIRPIGDMVAGADAPSEPVAHVNNAQAVLALQGDLHALLPRPVVAEAADTMTPIATPIAFGGFTARTLEVFGDQLRALGLRPVQGIGGASADDDDGPIEPGSMITVGLVRGDLNINASGTVTHIDGDRVHAFGHAFLSTGPSRLPMMRSNVLASVPSLQNSFKLSGAGAVIGSVSLDRSSGIVGHLGEAPNLAPFHIEIDSDGDSRSYDLEIVRDPALTPFLVQLATFATIDATERQVGALTLQFDGEVSLRGLPALTLDGYYSGPSSVGQLASLNAAATLALLMQSGSAAPEVEAIKLKITVRAEDRRSRIVRAWTNDPRVKAGDTVSMQVLIKQPDGSEQTESVSWQVPFSTPAGSVKLTFSDANGLNGLDLPILFEASMVSPENLVGSLNGLRPSNGLYFRAWRPQRGLRVQGDRMPSPPASLRTILDSTQGVAGGASAERATTLHESLIATYDALLEGQQTIEVTILP